jgi:Na+/proline symporter
MLTRYDYIVVAFYFVFMTLMSWVFKRFIRNTSDYFRGGGEMLWWMAGAGAFMVGFSAVVFTGMAGKAYKDGPIVLSIFVANAIGYFINYLWFAPVSRQTRAITAMQVVRSRFGKASEQFFTWIQIPIGTFYAGVWLMGLCVFVAAAFAMPLDWTIVITGAVVLVMALLGGSWSVMAGDFVQMLILMPVTIVACWLALDRVGGFGEFMRRAPPHFAHWGAVANSNIILLWIVATFVQKFVATNSMSDTSRYLAVKDSRHARKAALLAFALNVIGPAVWFLPPMIARVTHPDLAASFPKLKEYGLRPEEASYFAICVATMPAGMVGLLLSGIFGATMSSMDGGLNKNAGFFVKNFYQIHVHPRATERELLVASKLTTFVLGVLIIGAGLVFARMKDLPIFNLMLNYSAMVSLPVAIPLVMGLLIKRAPDWAGWSTVLVTLATSLITNLFIGGPLAHSLFGAQLNKRELDDWTYFTSVMFNSAVGVGWFLLSCLFAQTRSAEETQRVNELFVRMHTPVDFHAEEGAGSDNLQAKVMGILCMIYGGFVLLLIAIPNSFVGRMCFVFCGGTIAGIGAALYFASRGRRANAALLPLPVGEGRGEGLKLSHAANQPLTPSLSQRERA